MHPECKEIEEFLNQYPPFEMLPQEELARVAGSLEISYFRAGKGILEYGGTIHSLYIVRSGVVELYRRNGDLYNRLDRGQLFGQMGLLMNNRVPFSARASADTLVYILPEDIFYELYSRYEEFSDFVEVEDSARLRNAVTVAAGGNHLTKSKVKTLLGREAVILSSSDTIEHAAVTMTEANLSAVLIVDADSEPANGRHDDFAGILTDRDLCTRVLARGLSGDTAIAEVMSPDIVALDHNDYIFEAMLMMLRHQVHHLPVLRDGVPVGIIEVADILRYESQSSLLLVSNIRAQTTVEELAKTAEDVPGCYVRMVNEGANSHMIGSSMSVIGRTFIQRLAELAEERLGPPPVPYCIITLGSMARDEQLIVTDQDNAIIVDEAYEPDRHGEYFDDLTSFVCESLARCGYPRCTGNIMASNPQWRKTLSAWKSCFLDWIEQPSPEALLNSSIFFDLAGVHGQVPWAEQLKHFIVGRARDNRRFLACLARNALNRTPPLGFFRNFVMEKDGRQRNTINLKRRGTAPLADILRVHALAVGSNAHNSFERLDDVIAAAILPQGRGPDLRDAMEFISMVSIRHQARDIENGIEPDNTIDPGDLSDFERRNLKDAFQILSRAQNFLKFRYTGNRFSSTS